VPASYWGVLARRPYVVRWLDTGEWRIDMPGIPPILFPAAVDDSEASIRHRAEHLLILVLPED